MTLGRRSASIALGLMAGILAFAGLEVLRTPYLAVPGDTASLEFGVGLIGLGLLSAITAWGVSGARPWSRFIALFAAIAGAAAGVFGLYVLVVMVGNPGTFSRLNLAVLAVLLVSGASAVVLFVALLRERPSEETQRPAAWQRLAGVVLAVTAGIVASALFTAFLSTLVEPPCCPA